MSNTYNKKIFKLLKVVLNNKFYKHKFSFFYKSKSNFLNIGASPIHVNIYINIT